MIAVVASHGPSALWYATRGAGAMTLVLLTASVALGIAETRDWRPPRTPGFAVAALHRSLSLLALALLAVHVVTTVLDPFPHIGVANAVVPFATSYRPLWLALGTLACDVLIALTVTSLVRARLGYRAWRGVHWLAYACWPLALLHGLGAGSDTRTAWMGVLALACVAVVLLVLGARLAAAGVRPRLRTGVGLGIAVAVAGLAVWTAQGPLARGWARRAGTPASVLAAFAPRPVAAPVAATTRRAPAAAPAVPPLGPLTRTFTAHVSGAVRSGLADNGESVVDLRLRLRDGPGGRLRIRLGGDALPGGGLRMRRSAVTLGPASQPGEYQGRVERLQDTVLEALVGRPGGRAERLRITLTLSGSSARGVVRGTPAGRVAA